MDILMVVKFLWKSVGVQQNFNIKVTQIKKEFGSKFIEKILRFFVAVILRISNIKKKNWI